jgi:hypothetical protein
LKHKLAHIHNAHLRKRGREKALEAKRAQASSAYHTSSAKPNLPVIDAQAVFERIGLSSRKTIISTRETGGCINLDIKSYYSGEDQTAPMNTKGDAAQWNIALKGLKKQPAVMMAMVPTPRRPKRP